jgi:trk system potassium uptake protein TrkA
VFVVILGGGTAGINLARLLAAEGHEFIVMELDPVRAAEADAELEGMVIVGDGTLPSTMKAAGIERADVFVALSRNDEDNIIACQTAQKLYGVSTVVSAVTHPDNQEAYDLLDVKPNVSVTNSILSLILKELPSHRLARLLSLRQENLEIVEIPLGPGSPAAGHTVGELEIPEGTLLISVLRNGSSIIPRGSTTLQEGDQILAILSPDKEAGLQAVLTGN